MASHKFTVGQLLYVRPVLNRTAGGPCEIIRLMPTQGTEPEYIIKRTGEPNQRAGARGRVV
jgi:hypothetical protein